MEGREMTHPQMATFLAAVNPALLLLPVAMTSMRALRMMWSIGRQESRLIHRYQKTTDPYTKGPARGLWQFERGGGVRGVLTHFATRELALKLCVARGVIPTPEAVHPKLEFDDVLAAGFARLLLYSDTRPLPPLGATPHVTWDYYISNWRPGKPHRSTWDEYHNEAIQLFKEGNV